MPKETECARDVRAEIAEMFGDKRMLRIFEVMKFTGLSRKVVTSLFPFRDGYISVIKLSNIMG